MVRARVVSLVCVLSLFATSASAQLSATAVMTASSTQVAVGDPFRLQLEVDVTGGNAQVQPPDLSDFEVVGRDQQQSLEMGQQLQVRTVFSYTLRARRSGRFTIPAAQVQLGSAPFRATPWWCRSARPGRPRRIPAHRRSRPFPCRTTSNPIRGRTPAPRSRG